MHGGGCGLPLKEEQGLQIELLTRPAPLVQKPLAGPSLNPSQVAGLFIVFFFLMLHILCTVEPQISQETISERCFPFDIHRVHAHTQHESSLGAESASDSTDLQTVGDGCAMARAWGRGKINQRG